MRRGIEKSRCIQILRVEFNILKRNQELHGKLCAPRSNRAPLFFILRYTFPFCIQADKQDIILDNREQFFDINNLHEDLTKCIERDSSGFHFMRM